MVSVHLDERERCILYASTVVAKTGEYPHERSINDAEIRGIIGQMLNSRVPGFTESTTFKRWGHKDLVHQLRQPHDPLTQSLKDRVSPQHITDVSKFLEQYWDAHGHKIGPRLFRERGIRQDKNLSSSDVSIIYTASNEILNRLEKPFTIDNIRRIVAIRLKPKSSTNVAIDVTESYVRVFRDMPYHWLTKTVADETKGARLTAACEEAIALFEKSGHPGAHSKRDVASTTRSASASEHEDKDLSAVALTQSLGSVNLGAVVQPQNLWDTRGISSGVPDPLAEQNIYQYINSGYNPAYDSSTYYNSQYLDSTTNPPYLTQDSSISPQYLTTAQHPGQQQLSLDSQEFYAGYPSRQPPSLDSQKFYGGYPSQQPPSLDSQEFYAGYPSQQPPSLDSQEFYPEYPSQQPSSAVIGSAPPQSQGPTWKMDTNHFRHEKPRPTPSAYINPYLPSSAAAFSSQGGSAQTMLPHPQGQRFQESQNSGETGNTHTASGEEKKPRKKYQTASEEKVKKGHGRGKKEK